MSESINNNFNEVGIEEEKTPERGDIEDIDIESNTNAIENNNNNNDIPRKKRISSDGTEVGAQQINQRAPQVNRRFFQGLASPSARQRNREERRRVREAAAAAAQTENGDNNEAANGGEEPQQCRRQTTSETVENTREPSRRTSAMYRSVAGRINAAIDRLSIRESVLIEAQLVEEEDDKHDDTPVYEAQKVGYMEQRCKGFAIIFSVVLVVLAVLMSVFIVRANNNNNNNNNNNEDEVSVPSMLPTGAPTFAIRPTLDIVRERGYIRCGFYESTLEHKESVLIDLCHAISAVLFNNTDKIEKIGVTGANRFEMLQGRSVDLLLSRDTHTLEREVLEESTGVGFTFSVSVCNCSHDVHFILSYFISQYSYPSFCSFKSPYYYDGMSYMGDKLHVECAEKEKRFGECASLLICVYRESTSYDYLHSFFPSDFYISMASSADANEMLLNGTCTVITGDKLRLLDRLSSEELKDKNYTVGEELKTKEPLAIVTRKGDREFSDVINWVLQSLFYGEEQDLTRDSTLCQNNTSLEDRTEAADLNYLNAVHCMGNYGDILYNGGLKDYHRGMNQINNGSSGMLYAIPFGDIENDDEDSVAVSNNGTCLCHIRDAAKLNCGVVVPEDFAGDVTNSNNIVGMSVDYCRTLAAAIYNGDSDAVEFTTYLEGSNSSYIALNNGTIDVIAGTRIERQYDFGTDSLPGVTFSTPFYFGNETAR